ncbi:MAG: hypothetical protein EP338_00445 [Bacteroidetes bacterium]|nr:MAG: hypothetical protein EP338_00445 [Bacteroidota bacterium]
MKHGLIGVLLLVLLQSCQNKYEVEDQMYDCLKRHYQEAGLDLEKLLTRAEDYYVAQGVLKTKEAAEKRHFYKRIADGEGIPEMRANELTDSLSKVFIGRKEFEDCLFSEGKVTKEKYENTAFFRFKEASENLKEKSPQGIAACRIEHFSAEDFEHPYYRAELLITIPRICREAGNF